MDPENFGDMEADSDIQTYLLKKNIPCDAILLNESHQQSYEMCPPSKS